MACSLTILHQKVLTHRSASFFWSKTEPSSYCNERHAFYEDLKVYWLSLKLIGMLPYRINKNGDVTLNYLSKEMLYSVVIYVTFCVPVFYVLHSRGFHHMFSINNFDTMILTFILSWLMWPQLAIPQSHWCDMKKVQSIFNCWRQFQRTYEGVMKSPLSLKMKWKKHTYLLVIFLGTIFVFATLFFLSESHHAWEFATHGYILCFVLWHKLLLVHQCLAIIYIAQDLRSKVFEALQAENPKLLRDYCSVWLGITEVTKLIGSLFFRMYINLLIIMCGVTTLALYASLRCFTIGPYKNMSALFPLITLFINSTWVYLLCELGERMSIEVGEKFLLLLISQKSTMKNMDSLYEVDSFLLAIKSLPPALSFNGFATINRKLFITVAASIVTYVIVVLQFSRDYQPVALRKRNCNCTSPAFEILQNVTL